MGNLVKITCLNPIHIAHLSSDVPWYLIFLFIGHLYLSVYTGSCNLTPAKEICEIVEDDGLEGQT